MGIFLREGYERLRQAESKLTGSDGHLGELYTSLCPSDAVLLRPNGECPVCHRVLQRPPMRLNALSPDQRRRAIEAGLVDPATKELSPQESRNAAFWIRYRAEHPESATPAEKEPSLGERAAKFIRDEISYAPDGQRIVTKRLIDIG